MSENFDSELEPTPPELTFINLEQGKVLVKRLKECLKQNPNADLYILIDFGAEPLEVILRELDTDINVEHVRISRQMVRNFMSKNGTIWEKIGKSNFRFLGGLVKNRKHVVLIDDIEYEGTTLDFAEAIIESTNPECSVVKFPVIRSLENVSSGDNAWPFAIFDDSGMIKGYRMPWEESQTNLFYRTVNSEVSMKTVVAKNISTRAISLRGDLQKVVRYFAK